MTDFYQGVIASVAILSGLCAFIYWVFNLMEKRIELKLEIVSSDVQKIANELREERKSKDYLYQFVINNVDKK
jgi:hypothetical protein